MNNQATDKAVQKLIPKDKPVDYSTGERIIEEDHDVHEEFKANPNNMRASAGGLKKGVKANVDKLKDPSLETVTQLRQIFRNSFVN